MADKEPVVAPQKVDLNKVAESKLDNLKKLSGVADVNPFYAINALMSAKVDLVTGDDERKALAQTIIMTVTDDGKWLPNKP